MKFTVVGIKEMDEATKTRERCAEVYLKAKHPGVIYDSQLWVKIPWSELWRYPMDTEFELMPIQNQIDIAKSYAHPPICGDLPTLKAQREE